MAVALASKCIYCSCTLKVQTKPAHVFPEGLGGRLATTTTVCDDCNNSFSNIEGQVCLRLAAMGAFAGARRGDRKYVSTEIEFQGSKWRLENGRMDEMAKPPREKGRINPLPARREDQVATVARALKSRGLPAEAMLDGRFTQEEEPDVPPVEPLQTEPVEHGFNWGDRISKRVMIKIAIELLAYFDPDAARSPELDRARRFARYDDGSEMDFRAGPDIETLGAGIPRVEATWRRLMGPLRRHTGVAKVPVVETPDGLALKVAVTAPPDKGKANAAVIALVAKAFGVAKSNVTVSLGETDRRKVLHIAGATDALEAIAQQWMTP